MAATAHLQASSAREEPVPHRLGRVLQLLATVAGEGVGPRLGKFVTDTFATERDARRSRTDMVQAIDAGADLRPRTSPTVVEALDDLLDAMRDGRALDRSGKPYRPATIRKGI